MLREPPDDDGEEQGCPPFYTVALFPLPEDVSATEEEGSHQFAIAPLNKCDDLESLVGLPGTKQEEQQADDVGGGAGPVVSIVSIVSIAAIEPIHQLIYNKV